MNIRYCNICGNKMDMWDIQEDFTIHSYVGYGSKFDEEEIELHICCDCMDQMIENCAISPLVKHAREYTLVKREPVECENS